MVYNLSPLGGRCGLTAQKLKEQPLHAHARDSHEGPSPNLDQQEPAQDIFRPPESSDEESTGAKSDDSVPQESTQSTMSSPPIVKSKYTLKPEQATYFNTSKRKSAQAAGYGKASKTMALKKPKPQIRAPKIRGFKHISSSNASESEDSFVVPPAARVKVPDRSADEADGFIAIPKTSKKGQIQAQHDFVVPPRVKSESSSADEFVIPPNVVIIKNTTKSDIKDEFVDIPTVVKRSVSEIVDDDELAAALHINTNKSKKASQRTTKKDKPSPPKKRKTEPEEDFLAPPRAPSPGSSGTVNQEDAYNDEDDTILDEAVEPAFQKFKCLICLVPIDGSTIDAFRLSRKIKHDRNLNARQQEQLHRFHSRNDAEELWQVRHYPSLDWHGFDVRLARYRLRIQEIMSGSRDCHFEKQLQRTTTNRGRKSATLKDEMATGETGSNLLGYYGSRGQRIICEWLLVEFTQDFQQRSISNRLQKLAGSVGGFIQKVLVPELIHAMIVEDLEQDTEMRNHAADRALLYLENSNGNPRDFPQAESDLYDSTMTDTDKIHDLFWLARFVTIESAPCGVLLSEETGDIVSTHIESIV